MRISINCRSILLNQRTGIGRYTYNLLDYLGQIDPTNEYVLHAPKALFDFKRRLPAFPDYKNLKRYPDYFNQGASRGNYDVYHFPCPDVEGLYSGKKLVVTIHDLIYKTYPMVHTAQTINLTERFMRQMATKADKIICISEHTRQDLHTFFDIPREKTCVVHNGVDHDIFYPLSELERFQAAHQLKELGIDKSYVLFVGTIEPRKNLTGLLEAFAMLKAKKAFNGRLVIAGMEGWMMNNIRELGKQLNIEEDLIWTGFINDAQLRQLYSMAEVFVFPSFYEGFGFPVLEAFCCGTAVIASRTSSCGEIAGNAALTIDPHDVKAIMEAMARVLGDKKLKTSLQQAGIKRAQEFSFERMAQRTLDVYRHLMQ